LLCTSEEIVSTSVAIIIASGNSETSEFGKLRNVLFVCRLSRLFGDLLLQKFLFQFLEDRRFVVPQVRFNVVFGAEEDLAVGFPDTVVLAPLPLLGKFL
jgi:hypothetical protein